MSAKPKPPANKIPARRAARIMQAAAAVVGLSAVAPVPVAEPATIVTQAPAPLIHLRDYQKPVFADKTTKVLLLEWSRQIGKSHTLANWAADRALSQLAAMLRGDVKRTDWLIVVISNSKANGAEFGVKCAAVCDLMRQADQQLSASGYTEDTPIVDDELQGLEIRDCAHRIEIKAGACRARILILAASPRTARGFSGDLILDEFAFHENAKAIWSAAEPIIRSNPDFLCRIASTHNGPKSLFNRWITLKIYPVVSIPLSKAWALSRHDPVAPLVLMSLRTQDAAGRPVEVTPDQARAEADDQKEYDQNYELKPSSEAGALLTWELIGRARRAPHFVPCSGEWDTATIQRIYRTTGPLWIGQDVGRIKDRSVVIVAEEIGSTLRIVGILRMLPGTDFVTQSGVMQPLLAAIGPRLRGYGIDLTGMGYGLVDLLKRGLYGHLIHGTNFSESVEAADGVVVWSGRGSEARPKVVREKVTEVMARAVTKAFLDGLIEIPADAELEESLHKPERIVTEDNKVIIAAERSRNEDGSLDHADHFWALGLIYRVRNMGSRGAFDSDTAGGVTAGGSGIYHSSPLDWDGDGDRAEKVSCPVNNFTPRGVRTSYRFTLIPPLLDSLFCVYRLNSGRVRTRHDGTRPEGTIFAPFCPA